MNDFANLYLSFFAGILSPLGAVCVLSIYPAFISFISNKFDSNLPFRSRMVILTWILVSGVLLSMFLVGLIFSLILKSSLTSIIQIISPVAFVILFIVGILLLFNVSLKLNLRMKIRSFKSPFLTSFIFGLFFGVVVLPCNPASLVVLFALSVSTGEFIFNLFNFVLFGIGMSLPLILFAYVSNDKWFTFLVNNKRKVDIVAGIFLILISIYYLLFFGGII